MRVSGTVFRISPAPSGAPLQMSTHAGPAGGVVAEFLGATHGLSCQAAAELAGVRAETIQRWRRRLPRWVRVATSRRMTACLSGTPPPDPEEGLRRVFRRVLQSAPCAEPALSWGPPPESHREDGGG